MHMKIFKGKKFTPDEEIQDVYGPPVDEDEHVQCVYGPPPDFDGGSPSPPAAAPPPSKPPLSAHSRGS